ncbi:MAG TPA: hypothetical protein VE871_09300 [Longimicrobium sp.]|nr:hypothetical protein [Longimicrobium sp.]
MRTIFLTLLLTLAVAGSAAAQEQVRTGPQPRAAAAAPGQVRALPAAAVRQAKQHALLGGRTKVAPASASRASRRAPVDRTKRSAPRS